MTTLTHERLVELARAAEGELLETVTGKKFTVGLHRDSIFFKPASSGWGQTAGRKDHERFVTRYNDTHSLRPKDYGDTSRNVSYLIGLLNWAQSNRLLDQ
jgi:hypothetical protein